LFEPHSLPLTNELAEMDKQTYKEAQDEDDDDDDNVISDEKIVTIKGLSETFSKN
jgi:hypothetical protein